MTARSTASSDGQTVGAGLGARAAADGAGAGEMMVDLAAHRRRLAADRVDEIGAVRGGGVGDDGERRLQRVGEIAGMAARLLGLDLVMREQGVQLLGQRLDLARQPLLDPRLLARADRGDRAAHAAQRPQTVDRLQRGEHDQAEAENAERADQGPAEHADLLVERVAALRDLEAPAHRRAGQADVALDDAQPLRREFVAVVGSGPRRRHGGRPTRQPPVPERARREGIEALAADLVIEARIGLEEALVGGRRG